jgi:hypothetical protein
MSYRGATVRLDSGTLSISTKDVLFPPEFNYGQNTEFLRFFVLAYIKLLCDSPLYESHGAKPKKVYYDFLKRLTGSHLSNTIKLFSSYANTILENEYGTGGDSTTRVFHSFMIETPVFKEYHLWIKTGRPELLKFVLSFLLFGKKLDYEDPEFNTTAFRGWCEVEEKLRTLVLDDNDVDNLRNIVSVLLPPLQIDHLYPKFGPGKVAEPGVLDVYDKLGNLSLHPRLAYAFQRERPGRSSENGFGHLPVIHNPQGDSSRDYARQKFVPKDINKSRTISMEPNAFMYFQQEVMRWMVNSMQKGVIGRFVNLADQTNSQDAARHGSIYYSTDTIDLSSASDSVSVDLVKRIFPKDYLFYLLATRTSHVEIPGEPDTRPMKKFAPMGSALCFPVQCVVFTAVCVYAAMAVRSMESAEVPNYERKSILNFIRNSFHRARSQHTPFTRRYEPPVVYGDDIAVDTRTTDAVISILERLGFSVNRSKSFTGSQSFRESCGVFAFEGHDVTPLLFRVPFFKKGNVDAKLFASLIGGVNYANDIGYHQYASYLINALKGMGFENPIPFVSNKEEFGIYTVKKHAVPDRFKVFNANWQIYQERVQGIGPRKSKRRPPGNLDDYAYDQWWRSRIRGFTLPDIPGSQRIRPQETRLAPRWARCE